MHFFLIAARWFDAYCTSRSRCRFPREYHCRRSKSPFSNLEGTRRAQGCGRVLSGSLCRATWRVCVEWVGNVKWYMCIVVLHVRCDRWGVPASYSLQVALGLPCVSSLIPSPPNFSLSIRTLYSEPCSASACYPVISVQYVSQCRRPNYLPLVALACKSPSHIVTQVVAVPPCSMFSVRII